MTLEADGIIDVWEIETGKVIAQYEGLEVHEDMQSIHDMKQRIAELEATVQRLEQDNRRLRHLDAMPVGAIVSAMEWCDTTGADESIVNDIANFIATMDGDA